MVILKYEWLIFGLFFFCFNKLILLNLNYLIVLYELSNKKLWNVYVYLNLNMNMMNMMEGLKFEWNKNMGMLSNISMYREILLLLVRI